jgi:hypothetical protein
MNLENRFPRQSNKAVLLNREERQFIYEQLSERKNQLVSKLTSLAHKSSVEEILAVSNTINEIDKTMEKLV